MPSQQLDLLIDAPPRPVYPDGVPVDVYILFEKLALSLIDKGFEHYSARALLHQIRWHHHVEKGDRGFKANNNWTPAMARWFMKKYPAHAGFFEVRERTEIETDDGA